MSQDANELEEKVVTKAYQDFPVKESSAPAHSKDFVADKDAHIRKILGRLSATNAALQSSLYFIPQKDESFRELYLKEIEKNNQILGL